MRSTVCACASKPPETPFPGTSARDHTPLTKKGQYNATSLHAIYKFDIAAKVPTGGEISFAELATACGLYEPDLRRIVRFAIIYHRLFREPRKGYVAHSAASRQLAENGDVRDGVGLMFDDYYPSFARVSCTARRSHRSQSHEPRTNRSALDGRRLGSLQRPRTEPNCNTPIIPFTPRSPLIHSTHPFIQGWALAHNSTHQTLFAYLAAHPSRASRFGGAMKFFSSTVPGNSPTHLLDAYPWSGLGAGATVVDVGGSDGYVSVLLARAFPGLRLVVQDLPGVVQGAAAALPEELLGRVEFRAHDFFEEQDVKGAEVYLFRWILHDWPDAYVVRILRALVPALKKGAKVVVNDNVAPGQAGCLPLGADRFVRYVGFVMTRRDVVADRLLCDRELDMIMLSTHNSYEREAEDWIRIFKEADERFGPVKITPVPGALLAVLEIEWSG